MKTQRLALILFGCLIALSFTNKASAMLLGDQILFGSVLDTGDGRGPIMSPNTIHQFVVQNGPADTFGLFPLNGQNIIRINPEDNQILINFIPDLNWGVHPFNGIYVQEIDATLTNVAIDTDVPGWNSSRLFFNAHEIHFNFSGAGFSPHATHFNANLTFAPVTPEPATMFLLGSGLLGAFAYRRRSRQE